MGVLSPFDRTAIDILREADVLENDNAGKLNSPEGVIVIPCSDGDQMPDVFTHQCGLAHEGGWPVRPHMPSLHGGAILMAEDCPLYREFRVDELLLLHIRQAEGPELKGIGTVVLYAHAPCGAAAMAKLTLVHQIVYLMRAKVRVKEIDTTNKVICFLHVDYGTGRKRTYFISRAKWLEFWSKSGRALWGHLFQVDPHPARVRAVTNRVSTPPPISEDLLGPTVIPMAEATSALFALASAHNGSSDTQLAIEDALPRPK